MLWVLVVGGGTGAIVSQSFDPKDRCGKMKLLELQLRVQLGEAIGAPVVIKGGQVHVSKIIERKNS